MSSIENSANPKVQNANRLSQFFEILVLLSLVLIFCGGFVIDTRLQFWLWITTWVAVLVISFLLAIRYHTRAIKAYRTTRFNFSPERLHTLKVLNTPEDVMWRLETLMGRKIRDEGKLFAKLDALMGKERCSEIRATVYKYTKVD